ncbi:putative triacylglycerol lipase (LipA) [Aspergillus affinis]|uniref:putative triacylglycerol lipase (LipA) n=1 Tax=Aspergillus affinis TaxID=1070780 RepID=UPI0022FE7D6B|nr:putative triacylglycerol lipase [Aspergillus affinis]KAI9044261.1 putative triacylglycerol lipase [Aspergillus affinis]
MLLASSIFTLSLSLGASALPSSSSPSSSSAIHPSLPKVTISPTESNIHSVVFQGRSIPEFKQDVFLGIKYADKPDRFTPSDVKREYKERIYNATTYGFECPGYGSDQTKLINAGTIRQGEDCLNLNVIRPWRGQTNTSFAAGSGGRSTSAQDELLPVLLWIYGGGWQQGATADPRYNMSYIVRQGAQSGSPVLGVSINYRLAAFGFLDSEDVRESGNNNLGLRDQRVAMRWVQENIRAFGGDPKRVTIWGESAGAYSVGAHLVANGGDHEGLFRAAIMESGNAVGPPWNGTDWYQPMYDRIVNKTGCANSSDTLQCLRDVPYQTLYDNAFEGLEWFGAIDGTFIREYPQISFTEGRFARVPILLGTNTDEGTSFGTTGTDTDEECVEQLISSKRWVLDRTKATKLLTFYPNDPAVGCPYGWGNKTWPSLGAMYKRYESMAGDITMAAPRRLLATTMAKAGQKVYSYRWDVAALNSSSTIGVGHFAEIPFVFANPDQTMTPLGDDPNRLELGNLAARMWTSFATDLHPNGHDVPQIASWPRYTPHNPSNFVFRLPRQQSYVEPDTDREEGMAYLNGIAR